MASRVAIQAEAARLQGIFLAAGATPIQADILQPAETLLDLYGEDIRARAFVTHDSARGEYMLRPDFTVPVVQMHMDGGAEPARYTYSGKVFRQQEGLDARPNEHHQVGYEVFDRTDPMSADAEVFGLINQALDGVATCATTGDIGILKAAVLGLKTTERRKTALLRHIWRPERFRRMLDRFGDATPVSETRRMLLAQTEPMAEISDFHGLRGVDEVIDRIATLKEDAAAAPISEEERQLLSKVLEMRGTMPLALMQLRILAENMPALQGPLDAMQARMDALAMRDVDVSSLAFDANYGRSSMEYYDGFVFGFSLIDHPDLPAVATGGRYDALTRVLGHGKSIPAVGAVIRPAMLLGKEL